MYVEDVHPDAVLRPVHFDDVVVFIGGKEKNVSLPYGDLAERCAVQTAPREDEGNLEFRVPMVAFLSHSAGGERLVQVKDTVAVTVVDRCDGCVRH